MVKYFKINIAFLVIIFIWQAIRLNFLEGFDGAGRIQITLSLFVLVINLYSNKAFQKTIRLNSTIKIWIFWFIYASINTFFLYDETLFQVSKVLFILNVLLIPLIIMIIVASLKYKDINAFLDYMEFTLYIVMFIFFFGSKFEEGRYENELFNINELVLVIIALVATILINSLKRERGTLKVFILMIFPTFFIIMAGSRMGFGSYLILILGFWFVKQDKNVFVLFLQFLIVAIISFFLFDFIKENTVLGERLAGTTSQAESIENNTAIGTIFEYFGDRGIFYINGWNLFKNHPIFGIGLLNYLKTNEFVLHVEYMIHLAELGITGFFIYLLFLRNLFKGILRKVKKRLKGTKKLDLFLFFTFVSILFCASVLFLYNSYAIAYLFGLIILLSTDRENYINIKTK